MNANYVRIKTHTPEERKRILERKISYRKKQVLEMTAQIELSKKRVDFFTKEIQKLEEELEKL
ncbi:hypothetical protein WAF17_02595 [Bernardetia sp. ABR2-2B]|uniref:hypothetical protein n=1 Tax=Bernardetia sp. ABR2-2B TaxID=3127472 RepID=UPI0030CF93C4